MPIKSYSTTAASNNASPPNGFPEGMAPASLNDGMRQVMADVRTWYEDPAWIDLGDTPTYIGTTSFSVTGDKTATYAVGRRVRAIGTTPFTIYGTIATSVYGSVTTVTVTWDSGTLNATLNAVALNLVQASLSFQAVAGTSLSITGNASIGGTLAVTGAATFSNAVNTTRGSDIASGTTTSIGAATGNFVHITGTTTITGFGTGASGAIRILRFADALTLTHNATSLILPSGANITTATNDVAVFVNDNGASNWRCVSYIRANGTALVTSSLNSFVRVGTSNGAGSTNINIRRFTTVIDSAGSDITYADSATLGGTFTINTTGVYSISYTDSFSAAAGMAITRNASTLNASYTGLVAAQQLIETATPFANFRNNCSVTVPLTSGDIIRAHLDANNANGTSPAQTRFVITRIS
jgi:hypothetical protein